MAKKSKAKKRKQTQKRTSTAKPSVKQSATVVDEIEPTENAVSDKVESEELEAMMNEAAPREPIKQRGIVIALIAVVLLLAVVLVVMYQKTNDLRQDSANTGQDQLLQVHESDQNSLQPTSPSSGATSPQGSANPQDGTSTGGANQLQPQSSPTPDQLNQAQ